MGRYFTNIPVCPNCFNTNDNSNLEKLAVGDNIFKCDCCGNYFKNIITHNESNFIFPLFSEIKLNKIEQCYADWILSEMDGKFFITWPWKDIKFLPIILFQYLLKNPKNKIVVFTNSKYFEIDNFSDMSLPNILNSLFYADSSEIGEGDDYFVVDDIYMKYSSKVIPKIHKNINFSSKYCFNNKFELMPCFNINYSFINSLDDFNIATKKSQLLFIDESILSMDIVKIIEEFHPDLVISTNIDALWGDRWRKGNPIYKLFALNCDLLLFSVDLINRSSHNISQKDYFLKNWNIIPHTWDYSLILEKIKIMDDNEESFFSSNIDEVKNFHTDLKINLIECPQLGEIEDTFKLFNELFPYDKKVIRSLEDLMKTPLYIKGLYEDPRVLNRNITFEYLFNLIYNLNLDKWEQLMAIFDKVYDFHGSGKNPLADLLIDSIINKNFSDEEIAVLVHQYDIKGTKLILEDELGDNNILVTSWSKLNEEIIGKDIKYVISTLFPPVSYNLLTSPLDTVDVICSPRNMVRFDLFRMNRMTENGLKPVYFLNDDENAPKLLKDSLKGLKIPQEYLDKINKIHEFGFSYKHIRDMPFTYPKFKKNDNAVLILDKYGQGIFLKNRTVIYLLDENDIMYDFEVDITKDLNLNKKQLLINNGGYQSVGRLFFQFVINNGHNVSLTEDIFKWRGFKDIIESMFSWVDLLNKIVNIEASNHLFDYDFAKLKVAKQLSKLDLNASHEDYIINNWLEEPQPLETEFGTIQIYEAERPKSRDDLFKIYEWISDNYSEFSPTKLSARKSFAASRKLRNIRREFTKLGSSNLKHDIQKLNMDFRRFLKDEKDFVDLFIICDVKKVKIKKEARPFEIIDNPDFYIKE